MKLWVDDVRYPPLSKDWTHCLSVNSAKWIIEYWEKNNLPIEFIDIDHDAGIYASEGGDYINLLNWLEETGRNYPIRIHSMNPVGAENMRRVIKRNGWTEVT